MARSVFGGSATDWLLDPFSLGIRNLAELRSGTTALTFWTASTGGTQYTDLLDAASQPTTQITVSGYQIPLFYGPDAVLSMWADKDDDSPRQLMNGINVLGGQELAYAGLAAYSNVVTTATDTAIGGLSATYVADGSPAYFKVGGLLYHTFSAAVIVVLRLWDGPVGSGAILMHWSPYVPAAEVLYPLTYEIRATLSAGSHTLNVSLATAASQSGQLAASAATPANLIVRKA